MLSMSQKPLSYCYMISQVKNKGRKAQEEVKLWSSKAGAVTTRE